MRNRYTPAEMAFLKHGFKLWRLPELAMFFNAWFGAHRTECQLRAALKNHHLTSGRKPGFDKGTFLAYTREQVEFVKEAYRRMTIRELAAAFNSRFGTDKTAGQIKALTHNHKIKSGRTGCFCKGSRPWNTGTKGLMKPNSGNFKSGQIPQNLRPVGSERICTKDGYILIKVNETNQHTGSKTRFKAKHVVIWEQAKGPVPAGHILRFKDGEPLHCVLENLELITKEEHCRLNKLRLNTYPEELQPIIRTIAKVQMKVGARRRGLNAAQQGA